MQAFTVPMYAHSFGGASVSIDLGFPRPFLAWATVTMIDPQSSFNKDNAVVADIYEVDGVRLPSRVNGGDHWGSPDNASNVYPGAFAGFGQRIDIYLRAVNIGDLEAYGEAVALTLD